MRAFSIIVLAVLCLTPSAGFTESTATIWVTDEMLNDPPAEDWLMWRRTADAWAHSPLKQINKDNVSKLTLAWSVATTPGMQEITPLVHKGVMYIPHLGNIVQAVDATSGDLIWEYRRELEPYIMAEFIKATRHLAIYEDKIILATLDAHIVALDAASGEVAWDHEVADRKFGYRYTSGPLVFNGKIIAGMSGCTTPAPGGCFITAHDPKDGKELWRVHTIAQPDDPNASTWGQIPPEHRLGSSPWMSGSYDVKNNLTFWGTGVPVPYGEVQREDSPITALYTNSTLAIDVDSGEMKWFRQHLSRDNWDMDHVFERYIVDRKDGRRTVVGIFSKLGIVWALDSDDGSYLWSRETVYQNVVKGIHPETGEVEIEKKMIPQIGESIGICPSTAGGKNYNAGTYHPETNAIYIPQNQACNTMTLKEINFDKLEQGMDMHYAAVATEAYPMPGKADALGRIDAISVETGDSLWIYEQRAPWTGALLSTAGGLIMGGDANRRFKALDAKTGELLWEIPLSAAITSYPVTYSVDGRQYVAIAAGAMTATDLSFGHLWGAPPPTSSNVVMVFALPQ